jgi:hypothetical protein
MNPRLVIDLLRVAMVLVAVLVASAGSEAGYVKPLALALVALPLLIVVLERHWLKG